MIIMTWQMIEGQEVVYERTHGTPKGILALFHGCQHSAIDFWSKQSACAACIGERVISSPQHWVRVGRYATLLSLHAAGAIRRTARRKTHCRFCSCETICSDCFLIHGPARKPLLGYRSTANRHPRRAEGGVGHGLPLRPNPCRLFLLSIAACASSDGLLSRCCVPLMSCESRSHGNTCRCMRWVRPVAELSCCCCRSICSSRCVYAQAALVAGGRPAVS